MQKVQTLVNQLDVTLLEKLNIPLRRTKAKALFMETDGHENDHENEHENENEHEHEMHFVDGDTNERDIHDDHPADHQMHFIDGDTNEREGDGLEHTSAENHLIMIAANENLNVDELLKIRNNFLIK